MTSTPPPETTDLVLARQAFTAADQRVFALASGDFNPLHLDADFARRTQMGAPVVHGIHHLSWALDSALRAVTFDIQNIKVRFQQPLYLDEIAALTITARTETSLSLDVTTAETVIATIRLSSQGGKIAGSAARAVTTAPQPLPVPADLAFEQMAKCAGAVAAPARDDALRALFPHLWAALGGSAVRALLATSQIVGMACPGLHSLFGGLDISRDTASGDDGALRYAVAKADARFRSLQIDISGCGITGRLEAFARLAPPKQPEMHDISARVSTGAFHGQRALIIGGSRGLGEATAKIIAAGGGHVLITYRDGKAEAERVAVEIRHAGGSCEIMHYDALAPAASQLTEVGAIDSCYYFATGRIFQRKATAFVPERLRTHLAYYVDGFHDLCAALARETSGRIGIFYPSTVAIDEKTAGIAEYAMAKAAGETLANHLNAWLPNIHVISCRLPRILTDQTATIGVARVHDPLDVLCPIVYEVQRIARP
jgi:acyl dehydratase/NAD(P)-dependent dehydrogenase (short-subunit alcohol dehydrogenase family)